MFTIQNDTYIDIFSSSLQAENINGDLRLRVKNAAQNSLIDFAMPVEVWGFENKQGMNMVIIAWCL